MTPETFKSIRLRAGLTQAGLATYLRISDSRTIRRWEDGSRPISGPVTLLMEIKEASLEVVKPPADRLVCADEPLAPDASTAAMAVVKAGFPR